MCIGPTPCPLLPLKKSWSSHLSLVRTSNGWHWTNSLIEVILLKLLYALIVISIKFLIAL